MLTVAISYNIIPILLGDYTSRMRLNQGGHRKILQRYRRAPQSAANVHYFSRHRILLPPLYAVMSDIGRQQAHHIHNRAVGFYRYPSSIEASGFHCTERPYTGDLCKDALPNLETWIGIRPMADVTRCVSR